MKAILAGMILTAGLWSAMANAQGISEEGRQDMYKAAHGDLAAQYNLGLRYESGDGVLENRALAMGWINKAAEGGYAAAQCKLASTYESAGRRENLETAIYWYHLAGNGGNAEAQYKMARACAGDFGDLVKRNDVLAVQWYRLAADQGHVQAELDLAAYYAAGIGVEKNPTEAERLCRKSGNWDAKLAEMVWGNAASSHLDPEPTSTPAADAMGVEMKSEGGVFKVPVELNGAITLKFVVDSGAADVFIPRDVFDTLVRAETIKEGDFLPESTYVLADGSTVKHQRFILRSIKVGETTFSNIEATVAEARAPLLLGQSFLSKLKEWKFGNTSGRLIFTP